MSTTRNQDKLFIAATLSALNEHGIVAVPTNKFTDAEIEHHFKNCKHINDGVDQFIYDERYSEMFSEGELNRD